MDPRNDSEFPALLTILLWMALPIALLAYLVWFS
jgi:hypothetical protein